MSRSVPAAAQPSPLGEVLRLARRSRGVSQLALALEVGASQRHLAFVENGRARIGRDLLLRLLDALEASPSQRRAALRHAGFAQASGTDDPTAALPGRRTLSQFLEAHDPYPALVFTSDWTILELNAAGQWLCSLVMPDLWAQALPEGRRLDMIAAVAHPGGLLSRLRVPADAGWALLRQFEAEVWARPQIAGRVAACRAQLLARYGPPRNPGVGPDAPHLELEFDTRLGRLSFFTIQCIPALPQDVTLEAIRAELWFPRDGFTRRLLSRRPRGRGAPDAVSASAPRYRSERLRRLEPEPRPVATTASTPPQTPRLET